MSHVGLAMETSALPSRELLIVLEALVASSWTWLAILVAALATLFGALKAGRAFTLGLTWWGRHAQLRFCVQSFTMSASGGRVVTTSGVFQARIYNGDNRKNAEGFSVIAAKKQRELISTLKVILRKSRSGKSMLLENIQSKGDGIMGASRQGTEFLSVEKPSSMLSPTNAFSSLCDSMSPTDTVQNLPLNHLVMEEYRGVCEEERQDETKRRNPSLARVSLAGEMIEIFDERIKCPTDSRNNDEENISGLSIPSWASSLLQSSQFVSKTSVEWKLDGLRSFERQFGWDKVLNMCLGLQWDAEERHCWINQSCQPKVAPELIKLWSGPDQRLLRTLCISEASAIALDVSRRDGLVLTSAGKGEVWLWDLEKTKCLFEFHHPGNPATALHINSTLRTIITASTHWKGRASMCTWDYRCYNRPARSWEWSVAENGSLFSGIVSNGHEVYTGESGGRVWKHDTRMPGRKPVVMYAGEDRARRTARHGVEKRESAAVDGVSGSTAFWVVEDVEEEWDENCGGLGEEVVSSSRRHIHGDIREQSMFSRCLGLMSSFALSLC